MYPSALKAIPLLMLTGFAGGPVFLQPGAWETVTAFSAMEGSTVRAMSEDARRVLMEPRTQIQCVSPEDAADPTRRMLKLNGTNHCRYSESLFAGGIIRIRGICNLENGLVSVVKLDGSYTATSMSAQMDMRIAAATAEAEASMRLSGNFRSRRTGECTGAAAH
jgi:hypothetical protein